MLELNLGGTWKLIRESDGSERPALLPGDIMSALLASGEIPDPYRDRNELLVQWVGREDWIYARTFDLSPDFVHAERIFLDIPLIDTIAEVRINGRIAGSSRSMFVRFRKDVAGFLHAGTNLIEIAIGSPERAASEMAAALPYPIPHSVYPVQSPHRNLIRKEQCMAGWDWGPCLMTGGLYDGISLVAHEGARIEYLNAEPKRLGAEWRLDIEVELDSSRAGGTALEFVLRDADGLEIARTSMRADLPVGKTSLRTALECVKAETWWPAGHGGQPLYTLDCEAVMPAGGHRAIIGVGFREVAVIAEEDAIGKSMTIAVNGKKIFAKGANWIPADALPSRRTPERLGDLLGQAADAGMNCLRVWGGGRYESEPFYDLCDRLGILVWQDCMFSCALYPADSDFLGLVGEEIRHQALRLKSRACLALWCGNNEALGAITWYEESRKNPSIYLADYERLTEGVLGRILKELDPGRTFWPSSPSAGPGDYTDNWHSDGRGDMHFWSVWHEGKPFTEYLSVRPRFCSEFGFQSFPSPETVESFAPETPEMPKTLKRPKAPGSDGRRVDSPSMEHHQRHPRGNALIADTMARYFKAPSGFIETLYLSQVQQAWAIRTAVEWWRSLHGECMGTLYWQLNDSWPVSSWSGIEYSGRPKLLQYEAARFYRPVHLALIRKDGELRAVGINERAARRGLLLLRILDFSGAVVEERRIEAAMKADAATCLFANRESDLPVDPRIGFVSAEWQDSELVLHASTFLTEPKHCRLLPSGLSASVLPNSDGSFEGSFDVEITSSACSFFVEPRLDRQTWSEQDRSVFADWRFSDAGFTVLPDRPVRIAFAPAHARVAKGSGKFAGRKPEAAAALLESSMRFMDLYAASST
ncbi:MAG: glycoside hydrolase family 2 protein [Rectinemataceae bacterium]